jgi:hypothetical protein
MRCNPYWGGVSGGATSDHLGDILSETFLRTLVKRQGVSILYTHLGKSTHPESLFAKETVAALRRLKTCSENGDVMVTTTRRLLRYCLSSKFLSATSVEDESGETVNIDTSRVREYDGMPDLSGVTCYVKDSHTAKVNVDNVEIDGIQRNPADERGRQSVSIPWRPLSMSL